MESNMDLLEQPEPIISLRPRISLSDFFNRCETLARASGLRPERRKRFGGDGSDQLNIFVRERPDLTMIRMVVTPASEKVIRCDVVTNWKTHPIEYDEYLSAAKTAYKPLLDGYNAKYGVKLRLGISRKPKPWDRTSIDCAQLEYAHEKFTMAIRSMAVDPGDVRERLETAYLTLQVVDPKELPLPLQENLQWIRNQLSWRAPRHEREGSLRATLVRMRKATGAKIARRILEVKEALDELCPKN